MALIQWFPGHMHLTRQALEDRLRRIDVVVELLDARLPGASANPMLAELTRGKATLKVLNKQDLADPTRTAAWLAHYAALPGTQALALDATERAPAQRLLTACRALAPHRGGVVKPLRLLVVGIPNVGKSTLINTLAGKRAARAADEPGVTRAEQRVLLADDSYLYDTPGVLWPRLIVAKGGYHLAASGAIGRNAFDETEVALELIDSLRPGYATLLAARYNLSVSDVQTQPEEALLEAIGRTSGRLAAGGRVDLHQAADRLLADFRGGALGRITLETPADWTRWLAEGRRLDAERTLRIEQLSAAGHIRRNLTPAADGRRKPPGPRRPQAPKGPR